MTRYVRALYDCQTNRWQLGKLGLPLSPVPLLRGDLCHLQVKWLNVTGNLTAYTVPLLMFKTYTNWLNGGDFTLASNVYDAADTPWHNLTLNQTSHPFIVPYTMSLDTFYSAVALFTSAGQKMETSILRSQVTQAEYQGTETNIPVGTPGSNTGTVTITGSASPASSDPVLVTGLTTATGMVLISQETTDGGYINGTVTITAGQFVVTVPAGPEILTGDGRTYKFTYWILHL